MNQQASAVLVLVLLGIGPVAAQTNPTTSGSSPREGRVVVLEAPKNADNVNSVAVAARPERPEANALSPEVRQRLAEFKNARDRFLAEQEALRKQALGATDEERARLRRQLAQLRAEWLRRAREMRREFQQRKEELKEKLPSHRELLNELTDEARNSDLQRLIQEQREDQKPVGDPRRGIDP